jgi:hypothetical protein
MARSPCTPLWLHRLANKSAFSVRGTLAWSATQAQHLDSFQLDTDGRLPNLALLTTMLTLRQRHTEQALLIVWG